MPEDCPISHFVIANWKEMKKMMNNEVLLAFRRGIINQTVSMFHTRGIILTLIDEIVQLRKQNEKLTWKDILDTSEEPCYCSVATEGDWPCKFCRKLSRR